ncbi:MAG: WD40 repeat domain-containing protein [Planctomycetaceae bacterium]|nr:WD40 repeat domain-containing protein [Planctomycetaceae bacterium]
MMFTGLQLFAVMLGRRLQSTGKRQLLPLIVAVAATGAVMGIMTGATADDRAALLPGEVKIRAHDEYVYSIDFSADGKQMVTAAGDNTAAIWQCSDFSLLHRLPHDDAVYAADISPRSGMIATGTGTGVVTLWTGDRGTKVLEKAAHLDAVYTLQFSADGQLLATAGGSTDGGDTTCRIWKVPELTLVAELSGHTRQVYGVAFAHDSRSLVTAAGDHQIRVWNLQSREHRLLEGHTSDVYRCEFSRDDQFLASSSQDGTVRIWNLADGSASVWTHDRREPFYGVSFSVDQMSVAAVGSDRHIRIRHRSLQEERASLRRSHSALYAVAWSPDGRFLATGREDGDVYLIPVAAIPDSGVVP